MEVKKFITDNLWLVVLVIVTDIAAFIMWNDFLETGFIHDKKHGLVLSGKAITGHLIGMSIMAIVSNIYLIIAVAKENSKSKRL